MAGLQRSNIISSINFNYARLCGISVLLLFSICLFLPAISVKNDIIYSIYFLIVGWSGLFVLDIDWLTNPALLLFVLVMFGRTQRPKTLVGLGITLFVLLVKNAARGTMIVNENQNSAVIDHHLAGWYIWMAAQIIALAAISVSLAEPRVMGFRPRER